MKIKSTISIKWVLIIFLVLPLVVYRTHQVSKYMAMHPASNTSSTTHNFFEFLADFFDIIGGPVPLFGDASNHINGQNQNSRLNAGSAGYTANGANGQNRNSMMSAGSSTLQGSDTVQQGGNAKNNPAVNAENDAQISAENNPESGSAINSENNSGGSSGTNSEINQENNAENNPVTNSDNNSGNNPADNSENNPGTNSDNNSGNNPDDNSGNSGNNSGGNSGGGSGNNSGFSFQKNLPTINAIPSDSAVSQSIAQQNQNNASVASIIAARQELVVPVQQQAQATKYQTVDPQSIPAVSSNQAPSDIVPKLQSHQVSLH